MDIIVDRSSPTALSRQVSIGIRKRILSGTLPGGLRLPSTRSLAQRLGVSRNVVVEAYSILEAEGFVRSHTGAGTFVAEGLVLHSTSEILRRSYESPGFKPYRSDLIDFRSGLPDLASFPVATWGRLLKGSWDELTPRDLAYGAPEGRLELREAIANYVALHRGVNCDSGQVLICGGTTQAAGLAARLLLDGSRCDVVLEDPVTIDLQRIFQGYSGRIHPVPVDEQGLCTDGLPPLNPAFVYVTPSHHFPLGSILSAQRRIALVEYVRSKDSYVLEDDYDSEYRLESPPLECLYSLAPDRTIYIGTFSKTLFPSLRIGYLVLPPALVERGRAAKWFSDLHNPILEQLVLARFLREDAYLRHLNKQRRIFRTRRRLLCDAVDQEFGSKAAIVGEAVGLHLCLRIPGAEFNQALLSRLEALGVKVHPVEEHAIVKGRWKDTVVLGYGRLDEEDLRKGIRLLAKGVFQ